MKTITINAYEYKELNPKIQEKVINKFYDININYDWWMCIYEDAKSIGLQIDEHDLYRDYIKGIFIIDESEVCSNILENHGIGCDSVGFVLEYLDKIKEVLYSDSERDISPFKHILLKKISRYYLLLLHDEYKYLTDKEQIIGTIEANEYFFTESGELI